MWKRQEVTPHHWTNDIKGFLIADSLQTLDLEKAKYIQNAMKWCAGTKNKDVAFNSLTASL